MTANELHVPVGEPVRLELTAMDVIHSFWVPRIGWKKDTIPGTVNVMSVRIDQMGVFDGACAEFCGTQHAWMRIAVVAQPQEAFAAWTLNQQAMAAIPLDPVAARGQQVFSTSTCVACHTVTGTKAAGRIGPDLTHVASRATIGAGVAERTSSTLQLWISDPHTFKPGALLTGFHGVHVVIGLVALAALAVMSWAQGGTREIRTAAMAVSTYWHFVDIVWLVLFGTIYVWPRL